MTDQDARIDRVLAMARAVWGSDNEARTFVERPHPLLDDRRPLDLIAESAEGAGRVIDVLGRLRHGSAA